jgi:hypothetical protein
LAEGIRIDDAAIEISPEALEGLVNKRGGAVVLKRLDLAVSPEALTTLLQGLAPEGKPAPSVQVGEGSLDIRVERETGPVGADLRMGALRVQFTAEGLRVTSE